MSVEGVIMACGAQAESGALVAQLAASGIPVVEMDPGAAVSSALDALGTPRESTWVIAGDIPTLRRAGDAGLRTVCVFDEANAARQDEYEASCDILVHGWRELTLPLLQDYAELPEDSRLTGHFHALVVDGSPQPSSVRLVRRLAGECDYIIAADRGANVLYEAGVVPDVFCGDADSVSDTVAVWARQRASADILYPSEKYETDLGLAIGCARHEAARRRARLCLTLTCGSGGRPDHALAVIGALAGAADASPRLVEDGFECRILSPQGDATWRMAGVCGSTFSAIALREGTVISEQGSRWELDHREMGLLADLGISNVVSRDSCEVTCHAGVAAVFLLR